MEVTRSCTHDGIYRFVVNSRYRVSIIPALHQWNCIGYDDDDTYVSGTYVVVGRLVVDFDGSFYLPAAVIFALKNIGYKMHFSKSK